MVFFRSLCSDNVGDLKDGDVVTIASESLAFEAEALTDVVVLACFRIQSSLQYTEVVRDGFILHTMQFGTVESDLD